MRLFIQEARERAGYSQKELADIVGVAANTFHGYESGKHDPKSDMLIKIAKACGVTVDFLLGYDPTEDEKSPGLSTEAMKLAADYEILDAWGRRTVRAVTDSELARVLDESEPVELKPATKIIPLIGARMAAGPGEPDFGNALEEYEVPADTRADFAVHIHGDSMEPDLPDGSIQLCTKGTPRDGDVAVLLVDGAFYVKQICLDAVGNLYLFSLNRARGDKTIWASSGSTVSCFGTVIMKRRHPLPMQINDGR